MGWRGTSRSDSHLSIDAFLRSSPQGKIGSAVMAASGVDVDA
jgi:hypothetical protein